jgi:hypothetical protein
MNSSIPTDSKYIPLTQQKWLCVPTCIQMIMVRHNIPLVPSELLGSYMKLLVPKNDGYLFWNVKTGKRPKAGYGTQFNEKFSANTAFKELHIPLKVDWKLIDQFKNIEEFENYLREVTSRKIDVLVCYDWGTLFDKDMRQGHTCVLDKVDLKKKEVRIIDPEYKTPKWRTIKIEHLYKAMKIHGKENSAGFWEFLINKLPV